MVGEGEVVEVYGVRVGSCGFNGFGINCMGVLEKYRVF